MLTRCKYILLLALIVKYCASARNTEDACRVCVCSSNGGSYSVDCSYKQILTDDNVPSFPNSSTILLLQGNNLRKIKRRYFMNLSGLKYLDVSFQEGGGITSWDPDCFDDLNILETLKIKGIKGAQVYPESIARLSSLNHLAITLRDRAPYEYRHLTNITELDHASNDCKFVSNYSMMSSLHQLRLLNLSYCEINRNNYLEGCLSLFKNLEILDISCNKRLGGDTFSRILQDLQNTSVHTLYAEDISTSVPIQINNTTLKHLNKSGINRIYIGSNQIYAQSFGYDGGYKSYRLFDYLSMDGNSYVKNEDKRTYMDLAREDVPVNVSKAFKRYVPLLFSGIGINTERLYLNGDRFDSNCILIHDRRQEIVKYKKYDMAVDIHEYEKTLQSSNCCRNWEKMIAYTGLDRLFYSHIQYRHIRIENTHELFQLHDGENNIFKYPDFFSEYFNSGKLCICFYLPTLERAEFLNINTIPLIIRFIGAQNLRYFSLEFSNIRIMNRAFTSSIPNLLYLSMANNKLGEMFNVTNGNNPHVIDVFTPLKKLEELNLSGNKIAYFPINTFTNQKKLKRLILHNNLLEKWNINMSALISLTYLDLTGNKLRVIGQTSMDSFKIIGANDKFSLVLDDNKIECSCLNKQMVTWIQQNEFIHKRNNLRCPNRDNTRVISFNTNSCYVSISHALTIGVTSGIAALVIAILSLVFYKFHWLKYKFHIIKWRWRFLMHGMPADAKVLNREMIFISYENHDRHWVINNLLPKLEEMHYNTYIHNRDFVVGRAIADNIVHAIEVCAKTILVLSDRFAESEWCQFELQMALVKGADSVVPIQYAPIQKKNNTRLLKYLTKTKVYLDWCGRTITEDEFWNRLRYTLGKLKRNKVVDDNEIELDPFL